ncbi:MAG: AMP-binding protein [Paludisphaera borealis]|uniref:AMP-binding protein n=1 Tax=Paludisphaera borealis TaxID=1387353 RepID=UPI00283D1328|nr:AMP-binding protein [Paludisphaera borealis]MDR3617750.1 AMP-binding protein [Paludisphaera borealis]
MTGTRLDSLPWVYDQTMGGALRRAAETWPERDALVFPALGVRWSWSDLDARADRMASAWISQGIEAGEHVGIWSMNVPEWVVSQFAAARAAAVLVNINPAYRLHELEEAIRLADVSTLIVGSPFKGSDFVGMAQSLCPEAATADGPGWSSSRFPRLRRLISLGARPSPGWLSWTELEDGPRATAADLAARQAPMRADDVFNIQFTSGTTGLPKGAMLTHRNVLMNAYYVGRRLLYTERDRACVPVPFYHCFGCVLGTAVCTVAGAAMIVPAPAFEAGATLKAISGERCTSIYGVPTMFVSQLEHPDFAKHDLSSLRTGIMAGAPCPLPLMEKVTTVMGAREICIGYGQTEASPIITFTAVDDPIESRVGTVGKPLPGVEVKLVDPVTGNDSLPGEPGELCARGHDVMAGYYKNPAATSRAIDAEGWLHTGDLARLRDDGNYRIVGRSKELIIRGGENIYPPEVEEFLNTVPNVSEVVVAGLPDRKYGEIVAAWIVPSPGSTITEADVRRFCHGRISHFKIPEIIRIVPHLPRTVTGKVQKYQLRDQAIRDLGLEDVTAVPTA